MHWLELMDMKCCDVANYHFKSLALIRPDTASACKQALCSANILEDVKFDECLQLKVTFPHTYISQAVIGA